MEEMSYPLSHITRVEEIASKEKRIWGAIAILSSLILFGLGVLVLIYGLLVFLLALGFAGSAGLLELLAILGVTALVILPFAFSGFLLQKIGLKLRGNTYNLRKSWKISRKDNVASE